MWLRWNRPRPQMVVKTKIIKRRSRRRKRQASRKNVTPWLPRHNSIPMHACARRIACGLRLYTISVFVIVGRATGGSSAWQSFRASVGQRILAGGDAVDVCQRWASPSLPGVHADTGLSQVQILPARPLQDMAKDPLKAQGGSSEGFCLFDNSLFYSALVKSYIILRIQVPLNVRFAGLCMVENIVTVF